METPEFSAASAFHFNSTKNNNGGSGGGGGGDSFIVDELLADFPSDDGMVVAADDDGVCFEIDDSTGIITAAGGGGGGGSGTSTTEESVTGGDGGVHHSCNSSFSGSTERSSSHFLGGGGGGDIACGGNFTDGQFSSELCVPYDDLAELEWLSNFVEESFSSDDLQKLHLISGIKAQSTDTVSQTYQFHPEPNRSVSTTATTTMFRPEMSVPAKARSKRSRAPPCNWTSRLLAVTTSPPSPTPPTATVTPPAAVIPTPTMSSSSESDIIGKKKVTHQKKKETYDNNGGLLPNSEGRRCLHCATDKTPQWRTGPMGPKTLCNACGVRYKSGRLVPEYRPAASPTFVLAKHSNSHRKVLELRRQKEFQRVQQHQQHHHHHHHHQQQQFIHPSMMFEVPPGDDFLIHQHHLGTDFRQLI